MKARSAVRVHEQLLETLSACGMRVYQRRVGRFVVAVVVPESERYSDMTTEESDALKGALMELGAALATEGAPN